MKHQEFDVLDPPRSQLRTLVALVDKYVADRSHQDFASGAAVGLERAWFELSEALALGEEPRLRECPNCSRQVPIEGTRCRYCMARSEHQVPTIPADIAR